MIFIIPITKNISLYRMDIPFEVLRQYPEQITVKPWNKRKTTKVVGNQDPRLFEKYKNRFLPIQAATKEIEETFNFYIRKINEKTTDNIESLNDLTNNLEESIWCVEVLREKITVLEAALRSALLCLPDERE